jgi:hypothetical protein
MGGDERCWGQFRVTGRPLDLTLSEVGITGGFQQSTMGVLGRRRLPGEGRSRETSMEAAA